MPSSRPGWPGVDKPTARVVALVVLVIVAAAALRGYLPAAQHRPPAESGSGRAALTFVVAALGGALAIMAFAVIARLRDPRMVAPSVRKLPEMVGGGKVRASWRVVLIALAIVVAWLLIAMLLANLIGPPTAEAPPPPTSSAAPRAAQAATEPPKAPKASPKKKDTGDMIGVLLASAVPMLAIIVAGAVVNTRRHWRRTEPVTVGPADTPSVSKSAEMLVRAAEVGLAEMTDLRREPREAIIACYAAMERELANVPGAVPQDFDTPTEVLARAVERRALQADNAVQLVNLFAEARFSPHVMNEGHREQAVRVLQLVLDELAAPAREKSA